MQVNKEELLFILENTPSTQNIMLMGKHGIGKSQILESYYSSIGLPVVTLFLGQMSDPGDLIGLPSKDEATGSTVFLSPYWFPKDNKPIVLFLDELNRARPEVLQTIMDLSLNRKLAGRSLPEGSRIISAVNAGGEYQLTDLDPALVSRFNIYEFSPSVEDWLNWAREVQLDSRIIDFISDYPEYLDSYESEDNLERTPDRRSWVRVSSIIMNKTLTPKYKVLLSGIIGLKAASLFCKYVTDRTSLSAKQVLESFQKVSPSLSLMNLPAFATLNTEILNFINKGVFTSTSVVAENLESYIRYISSREEIMSHFISLLSHKTYPYALNFILENNVRIYELIMEMYR